MQKRTLVSLIALLAPVFAQDIGLGGPVGEEPPSKGKLIAASNDRPQAAFVVEINHLPFGRLNLDERHVEVRFLHPEELHTKAPWSRSANTLMGSMLPERQRAEARGRTTIPEVPFGEAGFLQ